MCSTSDIQYNMSNIYIYIERYIQRERYSCVVCVVTSLYRIQYVQVVDNIAIHNTVSFNINCMQHTVHCFSYTVYDMQCGVYIMQYDPDCNSMLDLGHVSNRTVLTPILELDVDCQLLEAFLTLVLELDVGCWILGFLPASILELNVTFWRLF